MRIYDNRLGRFLSVVPLVNEYAWNSPYSYSEGNPINYEDIDGAEISGRPAQARPTITIPQINPNTLNGNSGGRVATGSEREVLLMVQLITDTLLLGRLIFRDLFLPIVQINLYVQVVQHRYILMELV